MGNSSSELTFEPLGQDTAAAIDGSSRTCRIGTVEVEDSFTPDPGFSVPNSAQMRAFCGGAVTGNSHTAQGKEPIRFHASAWDVFGGRCAKVVAAPASTSSAPTPPPAPPVSASAQASAALYALSKPKGFSPDLWYAQAASLELHQKQAQLSYRALRPRAKSEAVGGE